MKGDRVVTFLIEAC